MFQNIKINSLTRKAPLINETTVKTVSADLQERRIPDIILGVARQIANEMQQKKP
jgi:hypothetical protein